VKEDILCRRRILEEILNNERAKNVIENKLPKNFEKGPQHILWGQKFQVVRVSQFYRIGSRGQFFETIYFKSTFWSIMLS
jgi:hypothetical protein